MSHNPKYPLHEWGTRGLHCELRVATLTWQMLRSLLYKLMEHVYYVVTGGLQVD